MVGARPVGGGCIGEAWRLELAGGGAVFAKSHAAAPAGFFTAEAAGLQWLADAGAPVPEVLAVSDGDEGSGPGGCRGIVLTWLEPSAPASDHDEVLGRRLAALHRAGAPAFGLDRDGFIGSLPQHNRPMPTWPKLYAERRLRPMAARAHAAGGLDDAGRAAVERLCDRLAGEAGDSGAGGGGSASEIAGPPEPPARLHGDLWAGNALVGPDGHAWLVDPAAHGGHREVDLAMMRLFGGFGPRVFASYDEAFPLAPGHEDRVELWQLWPLLVHAALFGAGYGARAAAIARRYT